MAGIYFTISSLIFLTILSTTYFVRKKIKSSETKIFSALLIVALVGLILEIIVYYFVKSGFDENNLFLLLFSRLVLEYIYIWSSLLSMYVNIATNGEQLNKLYLRLCPFGIVSILVLPMNFIKENGMMIPSGAVTIFVYGIVLMYVILALFKMFFAKKKNWKKFIPLICFVIFMVGTTIYTYAHPTIIMTDTVFTAVLLIMMFTIENPDVKMIQQIEMEKERADKANAAKSDFLSSMSHEIRTPLNAIVGFSECVLQSNTLEEAKENAQDIVGASQTLLEIVNGILDISKIESGKLELVETDYNPNKMIDEMVKLAKGRLGDKPLDFNVNIAPDIPNALYGDKANIKKVIINLLTNAIKYTDEGYVNFDVQCAKFNNHVRLIFIVKDSGRGIKKEDIGKLFTRFQRLDEEKNQTIEGTGLGLAITKQLVEMMKGTIVVDSKYGDGSTFTVALDQKISDVDLSDTTQQMNVVVDLTGKKVLVVDDNKLNLKLANKLLSKYNITVTVCDSGHDCYELIENGNKYDLILLDDMMPKMSGTQTLEKLRQIPNFSIPVIALTANAINGMKEKYLAAGFDGYLAKPIDQNELYSVLVKFMHATASFDNKSNSMVIKPEEKEEVKEEVKVEPKEEIVPRISKVGDIPKFNPDKTEIIVLPGDKDKLKEELKFQENNEEPVEEEKKEDTPKEEVKEQKNTKKASSRKTDKVKILIVDDNNLNIKVESKLITALGYDVEAANSGIEAIKMVQSTKYDLIFMDIMMPMMDGVKTLHELNKLDGFDTKVIALTADAVLGAKDRYLSEGFDEYITKPMSKEEFDTVIKKHLK